MNSRIPGQDSSLHGDPQLAFTTGHNAGIEALQGLGVHDVDKKHKGGKQNDLGPSNGEIKYLPTDEEALGIGKGMTAAEKVDNMEEIALYAIHVEDDPTLNPWTVCAFQTI